MDEGGSVTLIFYKLSDKWWREPTLNLLAAACQMSSFTHVELAIGSDPGGQGQMTNVCRVFNDAVGKRHKHIATLPCSSTRRVTSFAGVELVARTGKNPQCATPPSQTIQALLL